ncbi:MAG TPA: c-type cytochrome [Bacteroidetes bacterium]|nr:c-type cytochrome [Bacteroidota bacterium]
MQQAADAAQSTEATFLTRAFQNMIFNLAGVIIVAAFVALLYLNSMILQVEKIRMLQEHGAEAMEEIKLLDREPLWKRLANKLWKRAPVEKEKDILFDHSYDGIQELDNVLPPWWVALFYGSIIFGVFYIGYYHFSDNAIGSAQEYEIAMKKAEKEVKAYLASQAAPVDETNVEMLTDASQLSLGESIFQSKCTPCHGQKGEGNSIGPNLTDKYWLHGGGIKNVFKTIKYGVPEKGMISWSSQLRPADIQRVASYILSLQGTNPPNAKEPQGELWEEGKEGEKDNNGAETGKGDKLSMNQ